MTTCRNVDVTPQILDHHRIYGASDNTSPAYTASSRSLNYGNGNTIQKPELDRVSNIPREINYQDSVGLFGAENHFIKINFNLQEPVTGNYVINGYIPARLGIETVNPLDPYTLAMTDPPDYKSDGQAYVDYDADLEDDYSCKSGPPAIISEEVVTSDSYTKDDGPLLPGQAIIDESLDQNIVNTFYPAQFNQIADGPICVNTYQPAAFSGESIPTLHTKFFKVELINLKTGNIYIDCWLDVRLYNKNLEEHPYDIMYIRHNEPFYIGFHARNTRRLPYNVTCAIGNNSLNNDLPPFGELGDFDNRYLATKH